MIRTPKGQTSGVGEGVTSKVRRSIGEWEAGMAPFTTSPTNSGTTQAGPVREENRHVLTQDSAATRRPKADTRSPKSKHSDRTTEARACLSKAKQHLTASKNLKTEIKIGITEAIDRMYQLIKESEIELKGKGGGKGKDMEKGKVQTKTTRTGTWTMESGEMGVTGREQDDMQDKMHLAKHIEEHGRLLLEHREEMKALQQQLSIQRNMYEENRTYASVTARAPGGKFQEQPAMHSVVVTSQDELESGEQVLEKVKKVVNAKEEGVKIDKVRQGRDRKVIIGCRNREEIEKVRDKIKETGVNLNVDDVKNKDPLVIFYGVLKVNTDEDIKRALMIQNGNLLGKECGIAEKIEIRYRRKARNPHTEHVVARVPAPIWKRLVEAGAVHIDFQRIRVADQSPLVQCSRCLGYGHGKRFCREEVDVCSHCGGAHVRAQCTGWKEVSTPDCINCARSKLEFRDHSAFSSDCPVRRKWETIARSTVAYC